MKLMLDDEKTEFSMQLDMLIVLVMLFVVSVYYYGVRGLAVIVISVMTCILSDRICLKLRGIKKNKKDLSDVITGFVLGLMMSASVPFYAAVIAGIFAVVIGRYAFGGSKHEIFNCAAVGFLFMSLCFSDEMLQYPRPFNYLPLRASVDSDAALYHSMTRSIIVSEAPIVSTMDMLIGKFCGPMGTGFTVILLISALFLILRRTISAISFFTQLAAVFSFVFFFKGRDIMYAVHMMSSGMLIFGIIFLSCDYSTIPKTKSSRFIYGLIVAALTLVFQFYAKTENAIVYAVIISAPIGIELDKKALSFAEILSDENNGLSVRFKRRFNKHANHMGETITLINGSEKNESADRITIHHNENDGNSR